MVRLPLDLAEKLEVKAEEIFNETKNNWLSASPQQLAKTKNKSLEAISDVDDIETLDDVFNNEQLAKA